MSGTQVVATEGVTHVHLLKTLDRYFDAIAAGVKTFELRRNDRAFQVGDLLQLVRIDPDEFKPCVDVDCTQCTPRWLEKRVTYVFSADPSLRDMGGIAPGYVALGLGEVGS